jgi:hypothetical protein
MTVGCPRRIKGNDGARWLCVGDRAKQDACKPKCRVGQDPATVRQRRDGVKGAVDQAIGINEKKSLRFHERSVAQRSATSACAEGLRASAAAHTLRGEKTGGESDSACNQEPRGVIDDPQGIFSDAVLRGERICGPTLWHLAHRGSRVTPHDRLRIRLQRAEWEPGNEERKRECGTSECRARCAPEPACEPRDRSAVLPSCTSARLFSDELLERRSVERVTLTDRLLAAIGSQGCRLSRLH